MSGQPARILHVIESLTRGGAERLLCSNLAQLDRSRFTHAVAYLFEPGPLRAELESLEVPCFHLGLRHAADWRRGFLALRRLARDWSPALLHTNLAKADIYGRLVGRSLGIPVVSTIHEPAYYPEFFADNPSLNRAKYRMVQGLDGITARHGVARFVAVSRFSQAAARQYLGVPAERTTVIYNGIDPDEFAPAAPEIRAGLRRGLGLQPQAPVLLAIGRLAPQKGHRYLIAAMPRILAAHPDTVLLIRGDGPLRAELESLAWALGVAARVRWVAPVARMSHLLHAADLFVFPSLHEGLGIALLEAMAAERACVATGVGPIPEVVEDGRSGLLVPSREPEPLARSVASLLSDPAACRAMGARGRAIVLERFDIRRNVRALERVYLDVLRRASGPAQDAPQAERAGEPALAPLP